MARRSVSYSVLSIFEIFASRWLLASRLSLSLSLLHFCLQLSTPQLSIVNQPTTHPPTTITRSAAIHSASQKVATGVAMSASSPAASAQATQQQQQQQQSQHSPRPPVQPLIPLSIIDAPSQRFYSVALLVAAQAWKYTRIFSYLLSGTESETSSISLSNSVFLNFSLLFILSRLGIPRLDPRLAYFHPTADAQQKQQQHQNASALKQSKAQGLTYLSYAVIFTLISLVDAALLATGPSNPFYMIFSLGAGILRIFLSFFGLKLDVGDMGPGSFARQLSLSEGRVRIRDLIQPNSHILGQHTIHILPYSTARLSPASACYCIGSQTPSVSIPVLFNNTEPNLLQYSVTDFVTGESTLHNVSISGLVAIPSSSAGSKRDSDDMHVMAAAASASDRTSSRGDSSLDADEDELDEPLSLFKGLSYQERARARAAQRSKRNAYRNTADVRRTPASSSTQLLYNLPVQHTGRIRLERVLDRNRNDARLSSIEALVVECPTTSFTGADIQDRASSLLEPEHKCPGESSSLNVHVRGLTPLELEYRRTWTPSASAKAGGKAGKNKNQDAKDTVQTISRISSPHHSSPLLLPEADALLSPIERMALARERTKSAAVRSGTNREDYSWAAATDVTLPLSVELDQPGHYTYVLERVRDACGNQLKVPPGQDPWSQGRKKIKSSADSSAVIASRAINVHPRATVAFNRQVCRPGQPLKLLRTQSALNISLDASGGDAESGPWNVDLRFEPDNSAAGQEPLARKPAKPWNKSVSLHSGSESSQLQINAPGLYRIDQVEGKYCTGDVGAPWSCDVVDVPPPTAKITFSSIEDRCAGPVGVKALSVLTGTPPFRLVYEVRKEGREPTRQIRNILDQTRDELEFRPNTEGAVTYKFLKLNDANYKDMDLDGPTFTQVVHPLATARFAADRGRTGGASRPIEVHTCAGNRAQAQVELGGAGPWDLTYSIRGGGISETKEITKIKDAKKTIDFELPAQVAESGGRVTVSLVSIRDAKGCERPLATADLNIEVKRAKSSVGFLPIAYDVRRQIEMLDGKQARLPVRLEGDGPWEVHYTWRADEHSAESEDFAVLRDAAGEIVVDRPGIYTITSVRDAYCPGQVIVDRESYHVFVKSRPTVQFDVDAGQLAKNGSLVRWPVCQGRPDAVDVEMRGNLPLQIGYEHHAPSWSGGAELDGSNALAAAAGEISSQGKRRKASFSSAQNVSSLELSTITPGWHVYVLNSVGDTVYAPRTLEGFSRDAPRRLEQMVFPLPSAQFMSKKTSGGRLPSFCVGDGLGSERGSHGKDERLPTVRLSGTPPFTVDFELHDSSVRAWSGTSTESDKITKITRTGIKSHEYRLEIPKDEFVFNTKGKWSVRVTRVEDGKGCEMAPQGVGRTLPASATMEVEVAETAGIASASSRDDVCVGEMVDFVLQGTPPWTVTYEFNGRKMEAAAKLAEFSRVAEKAGTLRIKSVAHQQNECKTEVDARVTEGMVKTIHDLPSVRISEGRHYIEDLREGNQAEIVLNLSGVPPFSFTYQRTEPADRYSRPKVLETHTVTGVLGHEYRIWTRVEGTWSVTWLQDRWCQVSMDWQSGASTPLGKSRLAIKEAE